MKRVIFVLLTVFVIGLAGASEPKPIKVAVGKQFQLELEWDSSTGCQWLLSKPLDQKLIGPIGKPEYRRSATKAGTAVRYEVLTFKAVAEGKTQIHLKYDRLWEKTSAPLRSTNFVVIISGPGPSTASDRK